MLNLDDLTPQELCMHANDYGYKESSRAALMAHPQIPIEALFTLSRHAPEDFARHPKIRLLLATDPDFFDRIPIDTRVVMIRKGLSVGRARIDGLARDRSEPMELRVAAAASTLLDADTARRFLRHAEAVRVALAERPLLPSFITRELVHDPSPFVRSKLAARIDLSDDIYRQLATSSEVLVLWTLASNTACPRDVHQALSTHPMAAVRARAQHSTRWPPGVIPMEQWLGHPPGWAGTTCPS